jgi:biopolymer transport protein ExbD
MKEGMKVFIISALLIAAVLSPAVAGPTVEELAERVAKLERSVEELVKVRDFLAAETAMKVAVPANPDDAALEKDGLVINVKADGGIVMEGDQLTLDGLLELLKERAKRNQDQAVRIRGDAAVEYQRIVEVIDACQKAGLWKTSFATKRALARDPRHGECEDKLVAEAVLDPTLNSDFFDKTETRRQPWIVEHSDGGLEDSTDGTVDADDLLLVERTANCSSTHQGEHVMDFCDGAKSGDGLKLDFWGGLPAYTGALTVRVDATRQFICEFKADYPSSPTPLRWVVRKKAMKLKEAIGEPGSRLRGWISVEFDEIDVTSGSVKSYKIEGYFKPVILNAPGTDPEKDE